MCFSYSFLTTPSHNLSSPTHNCSLLLLTADQCCFVQCHSALEETKGWQGTALIFVFFNLTKLYTYFLLSFNKEEL